MEEDSEEKDIIVKKVNVNTLNMKLSDQEEKNSIMESQSNLVFFDLEYLKDHLKSILDKLSVETKSKTGEEIQVSIGNMEEYISPFEERFELLTEITKTEDSIEISVTLRI